MTHKEHSLKDDLLLITSTWLKNFCGNMHRKIAHQDALLKSTYRKLLRLWTDFLREVLTMMNFPMIFINWIGMHHNYFLLNFIERKSSWSLCR